MKALVGAGGENVPKQVGQSGQAFPELEALTTPPEISKINIINDEKASRFRALDKVSFWRELLVSIEFTLPRYLFVSALLAGG